MSSQKTDYTLHDTFGRSTAGLNFTQKAFQEAEGLFNFLEGTTPQYLLDMTQKAHAIIDTHIDRPEQDKDSLKALTVIDTAHGIIGGLFLFDDMSRYSTLYSPEFSDKAFALMRADETEDTAQVQMVLSLAALQLNMQELPALKKSGDERIQQIDVPASIESATETIASLKSQCAKYVPSSLLAEIETVTHQYIDFLKGLDDKDVPKNDPSLKP